MIAALGLILMAALVVCRSDKEILEQALGGDRGAQAKLLRRLLPVIHSRVRRVLRRGRSTRLDEGHVEDVAQQVWVTLLENDGRHLRGYDPERGKSLEGWVGMLTEREAGNALDRAHAQKRGGGTITNSTEVVDPGGDGTPSPETAAVARDQLERLMGFLDDELAERGRLVLRLLYVDQVSTGEAAAALGVNQQVIWNWQHKIRALARRFAERQHPATA